MEILAIIPARGGSKGLPGKNIRPLNGHPLIAYSIAAAKQTTPITRVIVSTDSDEIASVAKQYGAEVPFVRPIEHAQDMSTDLEVFQHALKWLRTNEGYVPDLVIQLRPTSPIRFVKDIETCIDKLLKTPGADSLRIVTPAPVTPYKMWRITNDSEPMTPLLVIDGIKEPFNEPRQRLPQIYWQIGTLDVIRTKVITEQNSMSGRSVLPFIMDNEFAIDIDDVSSFVKAEEILNTCDCVKIR